MMVHEVLISVILSLELLRTFFTLFSPFLNFSELFSAQDFSIVPEFVVPTQHFWKRT